MSKKKDKEASKTDKSWQFKPGNNANPNGRPKGSKNKGGLGDFLKRMHEMINKEENTEKVLQALERKLNSNPVDFYVRIIQPQLPKIVETGKIGEFINQEMKKKAEEMNIEQLKRVGSEE